VIRLSANLTMLFREHDLLRGIGVASRYGFKGVEVAFPYDMPPVLIREALDESGVSMVLINTPPGDFDAGQRGLAGLPGYEQDFRESIGRALETAKVLGCQQLHVMAGIASPDVAPQHHLEVLTENIRWAATRAADHGVRVLLEPINRRSIPGYILSGLDMACAVMEDVNHQNVALQFDVFHIQINGGDIMKRFEAVLPMIAHVQIAGVPDRHEPDDSEVNTGYVLRRIDELGYAGWIGCEYIPRGVTGDGLSWAKPYGISMPT
jgi:hydroxypyruvate isomerase